MSRIRIREDSASDTGEETVFTGSHMFGVGCVHETGTGTVTMASWTTDDVSLLLEPLGKYRYTKIPTNAALRRKNTTYAFIW